MSSELVITLPDRDDLGRRLSLVQCDPHETAVVHPILLNAAGQKIVPAGVVILLAKAIYDYVHAMGFEKELEVRMINMVSLTIPDYIEVLIDDKEFAEAAKQIYEKAAHRESESHS